MRRLICLLLPAFAVLPIAADAQQRDTQAMQRWSRAKTIFYSVEGVYADTASLTASMGGVADVHAAGGQIPVNGAPLPPLDALPSPKL